MIMNTRMKILLASMAMALLPMGAMAQTPPATPPADATAPAVDAPPADVAPAAAPAPATAASKEATEAKKNQFGVANLWAEGDVVTGGTLIVMVLMFVGTVYIAATKLIDQTMLISQSKKVNGFWEANSLDEGLDSLGRNNAFRAVAEGAIAQANSAQGGLGSRISRGDRMSHQVGIELERINMRLQGGMAFLATVGSICPFVGLFGTVMGIVKALTTIGVTGDASIEKVAGPVGEALNMTAIGLFVAVPAVMLYNLLGRRNKVIGDNARHFAFDVEKLMATSGKS
ncbi:MAG: MotA/TolQ/ExbB proton channel family protein [Alphaproteobacteria bacterium]